MWDPILKGCKAAFEKDYKDIFKDFYPEAVEEIYTKLPTPLITELEIAIFIYSDHTHDKINRWSITGLLFLVGITTVFAISKRQWGIKISTYRYDFCDMCTAL